MKISEGVVIQERNIEVNSGNTFIARYKGKEIYITDDHGYGKARDDDLTRFIVDVVDEKTGMKDVDSYGDFHSIKDAIKYALKGAMLI